MLVVVERLRFKQLRVHMHQFYGPYTLLVLESDYIHIIEGLKSDYIHIIGGLESDYIHIIGGLESDYIHIIGFVIKLHRQHVTMLQL